jgi:hypothetical protein
MKSCVKVKEVTDDAKVWVPAVFRDVTRSLPEGERAKNFSHYAPIVTLQRLLEGDDLQAWETEWETRRVERGALMTSLRTTARTRGLG